MILKWQEIKIVEGVNQEISRKMQMKNNSIFKATTTTII